MRTLVLVFRNALTLLTLLFRLPFRALRSRHRPRWVHFRLSGDPQYRGTPKRRWPFGRKPDPSTVQSLEVLRKQLEVIAADPLARGVVFEVEGLACSPAKRQAIAELFARLRAAGKEVVGYAVSADNGQYELLCEADRVLLSPAGRLELVGFAAEATVLGVGLRRLGVEAHFIRRGEYKTAPEMFTDERVSAIQEKTLGMLLDARYLSLTSAVARGRKLSAELAAEKIDRGPYSAKRAVAEGLVDARVSEADLPQFLEPPSQAADPEAPTSHEPELESFSSYARGILVPPFAIRSLRRPSRVAVVPLRGMIAHGDGGGTPVGPQFAGSETVAKTLRAARRDARCPAVMLYIDSPGGSALGSELILEEVARTAKTKPVVAWFDRVAASGGYMAALGATEIWAAPEAIAGSIGVFAGKFDVSALMAKLGVVRTVVARGQNSAFHTTTRGFTPHERASLDADIEETYQSFLEHVARARKMTVAEIHARGEGRIYTGRAALEAGLIDRLGLFEDACRRALALAHRDGSDFEVAMFASPIRRFPLLRLLEQARASTVYALWPGFFDVPGNRLFGGVPGADILGI